MKSVKMYQSTANKEQRTADGFRKSAEKIRVELSSLPFDADPTMVAAKQREMQQYNERAESHEQNVRDANQKAADLQKTVLENERRKQEVQVTLQSQVNKLDAENKALLGE